MVTSILPSYMDIYKGMWSNGIPMPVGYSNHYINYFLESKLLPAIFSNTCRAYSLLSNLKLWDTDLIYNIILLHKPFTMSYFVRLVFTSFFI